MLKVWRDNMDLQPVFNFYKAVSYMSVYFLKLKSETPQALLKACNEIRLMSLNAREAMRKLSSSCSSSRCVSPQGAVYYRLLELWLRKRFPKTVFINTSIPSECIRTCKSVEEIEELDPDSTDNVKRNIVDRYTDRPNSQYKNGMYGIVYHICFAIFVANYYLDYENKDENDSPPDMLGEKTKETAQE